MKVKILKNICRTVGFLSFLFIVCCVGGLESDAMTCTQCILGTIAGSIILIAAICGVDMLGGDQDGSRKKLRE